jgi:putative tricarboxylic transport membrane protein
MASEKHCGSLTRAAFAVLLACGSFAALAQGYPAKPIEVTVHTSAGSGGDIVSRAVAEIVRREKLLPQPMQVVNRVGGSGALAFNYFKTKRGDPYQLLSVTGTILAMAYRPDMNIGLESYTPVALMAVDPQTIMVPVDSPFKSAKELMETARKAPETLVAATTSVSGTGRLLVYLLEQAVPGAKFRFVNFKGGSEAVTSTAGGHTAFTTENLSEGIGFVEGKKLRVLAISSEKRLPHAPDIPTLQELGFPITAGTIRGFTFTAGVPQEAVKTMETALEQAHKSAAWREIAKRNLYEDTFMGSAEFTKYLAVRYKEYSAFYDAIGLAKQKP